MLSPKQSEFWRECSHRWNIKEGATRSGKTYMDYYIIPRRIRAATGDGLIVLIGNTRGTLERNILDPMREMWGDELVGTPRPNNTVEMFGRKVYVLGADKITQVAKLQGAGIEYCYGDEVTTWNPEVFQMLKSRLSTPHSCFDGTCNPDSPSHWFKSFLESDADIYRQRYRIDDNPFLPPEFVENLKREYAGTVYYKRFILGEWALAEGLVYQNVDTDAFLPEPDERITGKRYVSVDYGTHNPCVFLLWEQDASGKWWITKEYYHSAKATGRQKTDEVYVEDFREFTAGMDISGVVVDPSASSFIVALRNAGFRAVCAANDVDNGIRTTAALLNKGVVNPTSSCPNLVREFGSYCWDPKAGHDAPIKEDDHCMDAMRYFAYTVLRENAGPGVVAL